MKTNLFSAKGHAKTGPGGWYCTCCAPSPKNRPIFARQHKKQVYRLLDRLEKEV